MSPTPVKEPIAVVGVACRFPGQASSPSKLWDLICSKTDVQSTITSDRFNSGAFYNVDGEKNGCTDARQAYLLSEDISNFDASFFRINALEAEAMDPQQRLLLETVYEATESAGIPVEDLKGSNTSVYVGSMTGDYHEMLMRDPQDMPKYMATGTARSILSNRVSYFFDWKGPSMTIDTACSSSLVAVHQAVSTLRASDSTVACAAGANLILGPEMMISESNLHMLSPTGRSMMWDAAANGYGRGEGTAAIMMKTLSTALKDGDFIHGIIRETGVNSDGHTNGITLPSSSSQTALIKQTYTAAGLDLAVDRCQFFEAHGTGTPAGDPIEARAIRDAFFDGTSSSTTSVDKMYVGSIKTVIGHLEGCAGLAGLIKALEATRRGIIPPNMQFKNLSPKVQPFTKNLTLPTEAVAWPKVPAGSPRRASVNSFGFGGTNAHAIIESFEGKAAPTCGSSTSIPIVLSANSEKTLREQAAQLRAVFTSEDAVALRDIIYTLSSRRSQLPLRTFFAGRTAEELKKAIDESLSESGTFSTFEGGKPSAANQRIVGVFTGQGAQWPTMGRRILQESPFARSFLKSLEDSLASLPHAPSWTLSEQIFADPSSSRIAEAAVSQPLCTAVQLTLISLLREAGIKFSCVVGHSSGEIAAAHCAGFLSASDAIRVAYYRGVCAPMACGSEGQRGSMMATGLSFEEATEFCQSEFSTRLDVAADNAPTSTTISGDEDAIQEAKAALDERGVFARVLKVDTAYHSHHMIPCSRTYVKYLKDCGVHALSGDSTCDWYSSVLCERVESGKHGHMLDSEYWCDNMVNAVRFCSAVELANSDGKQISAILEVGPHPALKGPFEQTAKKIAGSSAPYHATLSRNTDDINALSKTLGFLWSVLGNSSVKMAPYAACFNENSGSVSASLPTYPWDHAQSFWKESRKSSAFRKRIHAPHTLLGVRSSEDVGPELRWLNILRLNDIPWLEGHKVQGQVIFPAAAYLVMAMEAAKFIDDIKTLQLIELANVEIMSAIPLAEGSQGIEASFSLKIKQTASDSAVADWAYYTVPPGNGSNWKCHARGSLRVEFELSMEDPLPARNAPAYSLSGMNMDLFYESLSDIGLQYSQNFRSIDTVERRLGYATASVAHQETDFGAAIHPAVLDCAFQSLFAAYCWPGDGTLNSPFVPTSIDSIRVLVSPSLNEGDALTVDSYLTDSQPSRITCDIDVMDTATGKPFLQLEGLTCTALFGQDVKNAKELYSRTEWEMDVHSGIRTLGIEMADRPKDIELVDLCERLSYYYLRHLDETVDRKETEKMLWHYQRIFEWIDDLFPTVEDGDHPTVRAEWADDEYEWLMSEKAKFGDQVDLALIYAVGEHLAAVVRGETTMLEHMVKDDVLNKFYKYGLGFQKANGYMAGISSQISHRYPRMDILEIGGGTGGATKGILQSMGRTFGSYTFTDISTGFFEAAADQFDTWADKMIFKALNIEKDTSAQGFVDGSYDMIIASNVLHATETLAETMKNVRRLLKPGGHLLLLEVTSDIIRVKLMMAGLSGWWLGGDDGRRFGPTITVPEWDILLKSTGFSGTDNTFNDFNDSSKYMTSVMLTQAVDPDVEFLRQPLTNQPSISLGDSVTLIGGNAGRFAANMSRQLKMPVQCIPSFEHLSTLSSKNIPSLRSIIVLQDLDEPVMQNVTQDKLSGIQTAIAECRQLLWVSRNCRKDNPYANMSVGLCRSLSSEFPHIKLQHINVEARVNQVTTHRVAEMALRFLFTAAAPATLSNSLWSFEAEMTLENGKWYLPRLMSDEPLNRRLASSRMAVQCNTTLSENVVEITSDESNFIVSQSAPTIITEITSPHVTVAVKHALLHPVARAEGAPQYLCYGHKNGDEKFPVLAFSTSNASSVTAPEHFVFDVEVRSADGVALLQQVAFATASAKVLESVDSKSVLILHNEDGKCSSIMRETAAKIGAKCVGTTSQPRTAFTKHLAFIHKHASQRELKIVLPKNSSIFVDFSSEKEMQFSLQNFLPSGCQFYSIMNLTVSSISKAINAVSEVAKTAPEAASEIFQSIELPTINDKSPADVAFGTTVDFRVQSTIARLPALQSANLFRSDRTYLLSGCTGGLGKALCRWMVASGARHLALTTRRVASVDTVWAKEIEDSGAELKLYECDVGNKDALQTAYEDVLVTMPPIAGVVNAAMVLSDKSFGELDAEAFDIVFGPKVRGTQNLHEMFQDQALDFFIMFSSLASIVGNRGQSNYAASNMFMTAIAEQRRAKNLAASVIHIGMVLGVGYVSATGTFERTLRQYNYMPIAETDFLNMFSQAILVGQPNSGHSCELITGLNRFNLGSEGQQYFWHDNSRFSHHYIEEEKRERGSSGSKASVSEQLKSATSKAEAQTIIEEGFCTKLERMLQAEEDSINSSQSLFNLGVDSLVAVEIRSWFLKEVDFDIPVLDVLNTGEISHLCEKAADFIASSNDLSSNQSAEPEPQISSPPKASPKLVISSEISSADVSPAASVVFKTSSGNDSDFPLDSLSDTATSVSSSDEPEKERDGVLSFAQERLWFLHEYLRDPSTYNVSMVYKFTGPLRLGDFEAALNTAIQRHASLRTGFYNDPDTGLPMQRVFRRSPFSLEHKSGKDYKEELAKIQNTPYDLENGNVIRATILQESNDQHIMILGFHHIVFDGYSSQILIKEMLQMYSGRELLAVSRDYLDYSINQRSNGVTEESRKFWASQFESVPPTLPIFEFAECKSRSPLVAYNTRAVEKAISSPVSSQVRALAQKLSTTPFHVHLATLQTALYRLGAGNDVCIGITDANRAEPAYLNTIGFFVNVVPLRLSLDKSQSLSELVLKSKQTASAALSKAIPFDALIDTLKVPRSNTHSPLFQVVLNYKLGSTNSIQFEDCEAEILAFEDARNPFDLSFDIEARTDGSTSVTLKSQDHLYTDLELQFIMDTYMSSLKGLTLNPKQSLDVVGRITETEQTKALRLAKGPREKSPRLETVVHYFEHWASTQPDAIALREDSQREMTYGQIQALASTYANKMRAAGLGEGSKVCVYCEPGAQVLVSLLAIAAIGGCYVPLDTLNPTARLQLIVDDCEPDAVIFDSTTSSLVSHLNHSGELFDMSKLEPQAISSAGKWNNAKPSTVGFSLYTSGTTGVPKGVALTQSGIVHHVDTFIRATGLKKGVFLQQSSLGFDQSLLQILVPIVSGGIIQFVTSATRKDPKQLATVMHEGKITHSLMTPTQALAVIRHGHEILTQCSSWVLACVGGEPLRPHVVNNFKSLGLDNLQLRNTYGPTEITISSTCGMVDMESTSVMTRNPTIGVSLPNYSNYVLDEKQQPVRIGAAGELVVGGAGVAAGYLNREELTKSKFLADPFANEEDKARGWSRMYRTGDKVKFLPNGELVYLGRIGNDSQIKLRGFRIELDEIANVILRDSQGSISQAAISLRQGAGHEDAYLVAFVIMSSTFTHSRPQVFLNNIRTKLQLPEYMVPSKIVLVENLPQTPSRKLDQRALDILPIPQDEEDGSRGALTETQERLKKLWLEALPSIGQASSIDKDSDFFQVGGNSLRIVLLKDTITKAFGVTVSVFDLFSNSTLGRMASKIGDSSGTSDGYDEIDWVSEARFDAENFDSAQRQEPVDSNDNLEIILTGATGFLGSSILESLLGDPKVARVHCVAVRQPMERLLKEEENFNSPRVHCYAGDLAQPNLGLSDSDFDELSAKAHRIIHNGADVSFLKSYQSLRSANVASTKEIARLASQRSIPVHFVSTGGLASLSNLNGLPEVSLSSVQPPRDGSLGYIASKWTAEAYLEKAMAHLGLPVWIHRPSSIVGPRAPSADMMQTIFKFSAKIQALPDVSSWSGAFDFVNVDDVAEGITSSMHQEMSKNAEGPIFRHHCGKEKIPVEKIQSDFESKVGAPIGTTAIDEWLERAADVGLGDSAAALIQNTFTESSARRVPWLKATPN